MEQPRVTFTLTMMCEPAINNSELIVNESIFPKFTTPFIECSLWRQRTYGKFMREWSLWLESRMDDSGFLFYF